MENSVNLHLVIKFFLSEKAKNNLVNSFSDS